MLAQTLSSLSSASLSATRSTRGLSSRFDRSLPPRSATSTASTSGIGARIVTGGRFVSIARNSSSSVLGFSFVSTRGYAKIVRKVKTKKASSSLSGEVARSSAPLELPKTLEANFGPITPLDLESWLAKGEAEDAARREADLAARRAQEDEEDGEFDDAEDDDFLDDEDGVSAYSKYKWIEEDGERREDPDAMWMREERGLKRRKRSPPPFAPGRVMLDHGDWTNDKRDCLVEYIKKDSSGNEARTFGIVRRPVGLRHWGIVNLSTGSEDRVNVYKITWQWFGEDSTQLDSKSAQTKIDILKPIFDRSLKVVDPFKVWKHFIARSASKIKPKKRIILPNPNTPRASAIVIRPEGENTSTIRRRDVIPEAHMETKEDSTEYISIHEASKILFAEIQKIHDSPAPEDPSSPVYDAKKAVAKDIEIIGLLDEPGMLYLAHRFMYNHPDYFRGNVHRGFACREPGQVFERLKSAEFVKTEIDHRSQFVAKLSGLMEQIKALDALKDADQPVIASPSLLKSGVSTTSESALNPQAINFTLTEMQWIERLKLFALSGEDGEDEEMSQHILAPLGLGSRPHHAFQLLSALSFISPYDNPHVLRYTGPKSFTTDQDKNSLNIIELADGGHHSPSQPPKPSKPSAKSSSSSSRASNGSSPASSSLRQSGYHESQFLETDSNKYHEVVEEDEHLEYDEDAGRRFDFGDLPAFAIDSKTPHEIDDAISLRTDEENREWIWIHVTDVARYVKVGTKAEDEARRRATSLYLPDASYGIFPDPLRQHLSLGGPDMNLPDNMYGSKWTESPSMNAKLDLNEQGKKVPYGSTSPLSKDRLPQGSTNKDTRRRSQPTLSFGALIDGGGKIEEWRVVNGLISNVEHISYDQLNEILIPQEASDTSAHIRKHLTAPGAETGTSRREKFLLANSGWSPSQSTAISTIAGKTAGNRKNELPEEHDESKWTSGKSLSERLDINLSPISERASELKRKYHESLIKLLDFATKRRAYRLERRATLSWMPKPDIHIAVHSTDGSSYISNLGASAHVSMTKDYNKNAQGVVTEMMLLAGQVAGHFGRANGLPMLYGTQDTRKQEHERSLLDLAHQANLLSTSENGGASTSTPSEIMKNITLRRSLRPPALSTQPTPNVAQGLPLFVSVTSPLRRYLDLVAHYQIKSALRLSPPPYSLKTLHDLGVPLMGRTAEVNSVSKHASRFWILHCLQQLTLAEPFRKFKALVIDSRDGKIATEATLLLLDFGLEANITAPQLMMRGQTIHVRVDIVNPFYDTLILKEVKTVPAKRRKP